MHYVQFVTYYTDNDASFLSRCKLMIKEIRNHRVSTIDQIGADGDVGVVGTLHSRSKRCASIDDGSVVERMTETTLLN